MYSMIPMIAITNQNQTIDVPITLNFVINSLIIIINKLNIFDKLCFFYVKKFLSENKKISDSNV